MVEERIDYLLTPRAFWFSDYFLSQKKAVKNAWNKTKNDYIICFYESKPSQHFGKICLLFVYSMRLLSPFWKQCQISNGMGHYPLSITLKNPRDQSPEARIQYSVPKTISGPSTFPSYEYKVKARQLSGWKPLRNLMPFEMIAIGSVG